MIEIFGYIGCIFVIISMLMTSVVRLRVINIYNLIKLSKADGNHYDMIRGDKEDSYFEYSYAAEPPVQFRLSHLSRRSEPL